MQTVLDNPGFGHIFAKILHNLDSKSLVICSMVNKSFSNKILNLNMWLEKCLKRRLFGDNEESWRLLIVLRGSQNDSQLEKCFIRIFQKLCVNLESKTPEKNLINILNYMQGDYQRSVTCPLNMAIIANEIQLTKFILDHAPVMKIDVDQLDFKGMTSMHYATENGNTNMVKLLLPHCKNPNQPNNLRTTPLQQAVSRKNIEIVKEFLFKTEFPLEYYSNDPNHYCPIHIAVSNGDIEMVKELIPLVEDRIKGNELLDRIAVALVRSVTENNSKEIVEFLASSYYKIIPNAISLAINEAARHDNIEMAKVLLPFLTVPIKSEVRNKVRLLKVAVSIGHTESAKILLSNFEIPEKAPYDGYDANYVAKAINLAMFDALCSKNTEMVNILMPFLTSPITSEVKDGLSLLQLAVWIGHTEIAQILLSTCENPKASADGIIPLVMAVQQKDLEMVKFLLQYCDNPNYVDDGDTILNLAAREGGTEILRAFIPYIVGSDISDPLGRTPMHAAASSNNFESLKLLHESGFDVTDRDHYGRTPLHYATFFGNIETVRVLIPLYVDLDAQDNAGVTPIAFAAEKGFTEIVAILAPLCSNPNAYDNEGYTPVMKAKVNHHNEVIKILAPYCEDHDLASIQDMLAELFMD